MTFNTMTISRLWLWWLKLTEDWSPNSWHYFKGKVVVDEKLTFKAPAKTSEPASQPPTVGNSWKADPGCKCFFNKWFSTRIDYWVVIGCVNQPHCLWTFRSWSWSMVTILNSPSLYPPHPHPYNLLTLCQSQLGVSCSRLPAFHPGELDAGQIWTQWTCDRNSIEQNRRRSDIEHESKGSLGTRSQSKDWKDWQNW